MLLRSLQLRAFVSTLLLLVQVLGLGHVALDRHTVSDTGAIVDVVPLATETHEGDADHLCTGDVAIDAESPTECAVVAAFASPTVVSEPVGVKWMPLAMLGSISSETRAAPQFDALSRAPKASPPLS